MSSTYDRRSFLSRGLLAAGGIAGAATLSELLTACGSSSSSTSSSTAGPSGSSSSSLATVALQLSWIKNVEFAGSYIADSKGYYKKSGVNVTLIAGGPTVAAEPVVVAKKALVGMGSSDTTAAAVAKGAGLKIIAAQYQKNPFALMSLAKSPIKTPEDMYGKKIGVQATNETLWATFIKANKLDASKITKVPVQFDPSPLAQGTVDGWISYITNEPIELKEKGVDTYTFLFQDFNYPEYANTYLVRTDALSDKTERAQIVAVLKGEVLGWQDSVKDPALGAKLAAETYGKSLGLKAAEQTLESKAQNLLIESADTKAHGLFWMTDDLIEKSVATVALSGTKISKDLFTREILEEVFDGKTTLS